MYRMRKLFARLFRKPNDKDLEILARVKFPCC